MPARRVVLPIAMFIVGLVALAGASLYALAPAPPPAGTTAVGGPFTLTNQDGKTVTERDFSGATHLMFFGFTHCPDVCPTTLQQITDVMAALGPKADKLKVAFVSVDPERDTPEVLKTYLSSFDPRITGLTGSPEQVAATVKAYRGFAKKMPGANGDYVMEHTALVYVMNARNEFVSALNLARPPQDSAAELKTKL